MYPKNLSLYQHTFSEEKVYNALKAQLPKEVSVFFSVSWISIINGIKEQSECDFLIFDPKYGYLACEVKGGTGLKKENESWILIENNEERVLRRSPMKQAEESARYFYEQYRKEYNYNFQGIYGSIAIFPNFKINDPVLYDNNPKELVLDISDMSNLENCIQKAFFIWKRAHSVYRFSQDQKQKFIDLINKRIAISAAAGALISDKEHELLTINRVQDNYIYMIKDYNKAFITGGAGTGKTWIALKLANKMEKLGKKVLVTCYNKELIKFFKKNLEKSCVCSIDELLLKDGINGNQINNSSSVFDEYSSLKYEKYDCIIVDEAQDCDMYIAMVIRMHLIDESSSLFVFYDMTQNLYDKDFKDGFLIDNPPFYLRENLRNTSSIYSWAQKNTNLGKDVITNQIVGPKPESIKFDDIHDLKESLENTLIKLIDEEYVRNEFITILVDEELYGLIGDGKYGRWKLVNKTEVDYNEISCYKVDEFKGLESNVVFYIHKSNSGASFNYVAYTRAKYYLYEYILKNK